MTVHGADRQQHLDEHLVVSARPGECRCFLSAVECFDHTVALEIRRGGGGECRQHGLAVIGSAGVDERLLRVGGGCGVVAEPDTVRVGPHPSIACDRNPDQLRICPEQ